jgi:glutamyl-Q tRNA(Asp) synthetase
VVGLITRFAPSPTGPLHLGHAFSALTAYDMARAADGEFLLRIEDIDTARCRPEYVAGIYQDLRWLGVTWPEPVLHQSRQTSAYSEALSRLSAMGVTYFCTCTRGDIRAALSAPQEGAQQIGPDGPIYPGTCRHAHHRGKDGPAAIRLDMAKALARIGPVSFTEIGPLKAGQHRYAQDELVHHVGDVILGRRDIGTSYHVAVIVDDAAQGVTHVVRGADLFDATPIHVVLQRLLALPTPLYHHHRLIRDEKGVRLAKRDDARALAKYRADGATPAEIRASVGL